MLPAPPLKLRSPPDPVPPKTCPPPVASISYEPKVAWLLPPFGLLLEKPPSPTLYAIEVLPRTGRTLLIDDPPPPPARLALTVEFPKPAAPPPTINTRKNEYLFGSISKIPDPGVLKYSMVGLILGRPGVFANPSGLPRGSTNGSCTLRPIRSSPLQSGTRSRQLAGLVSRHTAVRQPQASMAWQT